MKKTEKKKDNRPKVSVIIPVYNGEQTLRECLESVLDQTYANYDVFVVDNNSSDTTKSIILEFKRRSKKFNYIFEEQQGVGKARNTGIEHSTGEVLIFTDSDCVVPRNWIEGLTEPIRNKGEQVTVGPARDLIKNFWTKNIQRGNMAGFNQEKRGKYIKVLDGNNFAVRASFIKKILFDPHIKMCDDYDLLLRVKKVSKIRYLPSIKVGHRHQCSLKGAIRMFSIRGYWMKVISLKYRAKQKPKIQSLRNNIGYIYDTLVSNKSFSNKYYTLVVFISWKIGSFFAVLKNPERKIPSYDFLIVGSGFSGSVLAEQLASLKKKILVIDKKDHIGGNCYDYSSNGILVQKYGPHIFHTNSKRVYNYLCRFTEWVDYKHKVLAFYKKKYYPIPINLDTVNQFYDLDLNETQLRKFLNTKRAKIREIKNSKDVVVSKFGKELYEAFIKHFTKKRWGVYPEKLDKSVLERLPIRYNKNPYYFDDPYQGMPKKGYTSIFKRMLKSKYIEIVLNTDFFKTKNKISYKALIYTGPLDAFFNYKYGKLDYKGFNFVFETLQQRSFQPNSTVNYTGPGAEFSRITEFKKFYDIQSDKTIICKEFLGSKEPSYPLMDDRNQKLAQKYLAEAKKIKNVYFVGRLAEYKYLNIDQAIENSLELFERIKYKHL